MDALNFKSHLDNSIQLLLELTQEYCYNDLSENFSFLIEPSGRDFHNGLTTFEKEHLITLNRFANRLLTSDEVLGLLYCDNKVPLWINMTIYESRKNKTVIHLFCSRRLRHDNELFYKAVKYPPFNVLVPLPPDPLRKDIDGKFDINWKKKLDEKRSPKSILKKIKELFARSKESTAANIRLGSLFVIRSNPNEN